ncbi:TPA: hypothetical protein DDZ86_02965 [Candidatus Dependentiae bacterium]|nr:MAG: Membrane-bound metal-dependent hydrolase [candidate division TM6 bacterium GW2011_GWF2_43_87]HBL98580.1 hypothetical protein [Candidatus Dependentiae bacterium]
MPGYRGHALGVFVMAIPLAFLGGWYGLGVLELLQGLVFMFWGAFFPDVDTTGRGRRFFYALLLLFILISLLMKSVLIAICCTAVGLLASISRHRGIFHNLYFLFFLTAALCGWLVNVIPEFRLEVVWAGVFFFLGCFSHLFMDFGWRRTFAWRS